MTQGEVSTKIPENPDVRPVPEMIAFVLVEYFPEKFRVARSDQRAVGE